MPVCDTYVEVMTTPRSVLVTVVVGLVGIEGARTDITLKLAIAAMAPQLEDLPLTLLVATHATL